MIPYYSFVALSFLEVKVDIMNINNITKSHHRYSGRGISVFENLSDVQKYLSIVNYPATKEEIFKKVASQGANSNVITLFQVLPPDRTYHTPKDALKALGLTN